MNCKSKILTVGLCCLDIVSELTAFPKEDSDQRCLYQRWQRGGNAANNATVLSLLGANPSFLGTFSKSHELGFILEDFAKYDIDITNMVLHENCDFPSSFVIISLSTGSRTIIHSNKNLPELNFEDFLKVNLNDYSWIHFEGRNVEEVCKMISHIRIYNEEHASAPITVSVEVEKSKPELSALIPIADVIFISKDYAHFIGYSDMFDTVKTVSLSTKPGSIVICPWAAEGACGIKGNAKQIVQSPAFSPVQVVDTLGAGDTFISATIFGLWSGISLQGSLTFGCKVAGCKVGAKGWEGLKTSLESLDCISSLNEKLSKNILNSDEKELQTNS